jgi:hypothetical protein
MPVIDIGEPRVERRLHVEGIVGARMRLLA